MANVGCVLGRHRWTWDESDTIECFRCHKRRQVGKAPLCHVGIHRWVWQAKEGDEAYRECRFCRKYGGSPRFGGSYMGGS